MWSSVAISVGLCALGCGRHGFGPDDAPPVEDGKGLVANYVFVTSTTQSPMTFGSDLSGADQICMTRAAAGRLPGHYTAWLSTDSLNARDRFGGARGWVRVDGKPFVDRIEDLVAGRIYDPLRIDELGEDIGTTGDFAATGTLPDGSANTTCTSYTDSTAAVRFGAPWFTVDRWTDADITSCTTPLRLYCFGVDLSNPLVVTPAQGRRAFVTAQPFTMGGGVGAADTHCTTEAGLGGLTGDFLAMLSTATESASSRFDLRPGPPWVRLDGIPLAATPLAFMTGDLQTSLALDQLGNPTDALVWTGGDPVIAGGYTCGDWTDAGQTGSKGTSNSASGELFDEDNSSSCTDIARLYCLEK